jgi:hypothetical protein
MTTSMSNSWAAGCILWSVLCISYTWRWERVNRAHAEWSTCRLYSLFSSSSFTTYLYLLQESEYSLYAWLYKEETFVHIENRMCIIAFLFCNVIICATSSPLFGKLWNLFSLENVSTWQYIIYIIYTPNYLKTLLNGWCVYIVIADEVIYGRETEGHICRVIHRHHQFNSFNEFRETKSFLNGKSRRQREHRKAKQRSKETKFQPCAEGEEGIVCIFIVKRK